MSTGLDNLKHIVVLMMENRSFDHMLGFAKSASWPIDGLSGTESNRDSTGELVTVSSDSMYAGDFTPDPGHSLFSTLTQLYVDAKTPVAQQPNMNGFVVSYEGKNGSNIKAAHRIMKCFSPQKVSILTKLAQQYAVCDRWFSSVPGPTFPNRAFAHSATSVGRVDMDVNWLNLTKTIYELLVENNIDSRIYYTDSTMAMTFKGLMNQGRYFSLIEDFYSDCNKNNLPAYSFLEPRYANSEDTSSNTFFSASDQHPDHNVEQGELLIKQVYEAVWKNPQVRNSTLLVVVYDEHGGLYDHVPPPTAPNPDNKNWGGAPGFLDPPFDFTRLGVRVPAVLISPYIKAGTIDSTVYDHGSLAATACKLFLKNVSNAFLTQRDKNAHTFEFNLTLDQPRTDQINFSAPPQMAIAPINAAAHLDMPINDHLRALVECASFVEKQVLPPNEQSHQNPDDIKTERQASNYLRVTNAKLLAAAKRNSASNTAAGAAKKS
jgi:phospholipase C